MEISFDSKKNGALVKLGKTQVFARIQTNIKEPKRERQGEGFLLIRVNLAMLHNHFLGQSARSLGDKISKVLE